MLHDISDMRRRLFAACSSYSASPAASPLKFCHLFRAGRKVRSISAMSVHALEHPGSARLAMMTASIHCEE